MYILILFVLFQFFGVQLVSNTQNLTCPDETPRNCFCVPSSYYYPGANVKCSQISDVDDLHERVSVLKDNPVDVLQLDNISLPYLPRDGLFQDTYIQNLWLSNSDLNYIAPPDKKGPSPFVGLEDSVNIVKIEGLLDLVHMDWSEFSVLKKLSGISLYNLNLHKIDQSFSTLPDSFVNFELLEGRVTSIAPGAFDLAGLHHVGVTGNQINRLDRDIFGNNTKLAIILLSMNQLKEVSDDFLDNLPAVNFIDLGRNNLTRLPSSLQRNWAQFENMYLAYNPLICDCELLWFLKAAKTQPPKYGDLEFIKCDSPLNLRNRTLLTLDETDLCP